MFVVSLAGRTSASLFRSYLLRRFYIAKGVAIIGVSTDCGSLYKVFQYHGIVDVSGSFAIL